MPTEATAARLFESACALDAATRELWAAYVEVLNELREQLECEPVAEESVRLSALGVTVHRALTSTGDACEAFGQERFPRDMKLEVE